MPPTVERRHGGELRVFNCRGPIYDFIFFGECQ